MLQLLLTETVSFSFLRAGCLRSHFAAANSTRQRLGRHVASDGVDRSAGAWHLIAKGQRRRLTIQSVVVSSCVLAKRP